MSARTLAVLFVAPLLLVATACGSGSGDPAQPSPGATNQPSGPASAVELTWWGQSMFVLQTADGTRILMDPYGDIGYRLPDPSELNADVATISHEHPDHNNVALAGDAEILRGIGELTTNTIDERVGETHVYSVGSFHDNVQGEERGPNVIFVFETGGMRIAHMGDIGQAALTPEQLGAIGQVDVLLMPVGGVFTVDAAGATDIVAQLAPRIVIPMHYKTPALNIDLEPVDAFLDGKVVREFPSSTVGLDVGALPALGSAEVWVLQPLGG